MEVYCNIDNEESEFTRDCTGMLQMEDVNCESNNA